jgi:hypothetical protein
MQLFTAKNYFDRLARHNCNQFINSVRRRGLAERLLGRNWYTIYDLITVMSCQTCCNNVLHFLTFLFILPTMLPLFVGLLTIKRLNASLTFHSSSSPIYFHGLPWLRIPHEGIPRSFTFVNGVEFPGWISPCENSPISAVM